MRELLFWLQSVHKNEIERDKEHFNDDFDELRILNKIAFLIVLKAGLIDNGLLDGVILLTDIESSGDKRNLTLG